MAIADDFSVAINGDIRWTGTTATYTVLEFHRFLQDLADDAVSSGDDLLAIPEETPSDRSTDNIISLINGYNITSTEAQHLYDGSITQSGGDERWAGLVVVGSVVSGTEVIIIQDNALLTDTWTSAPNADAANNIILRSMVKIREDGADIDGGRIIVMAREFGDSYAEFSVTMGLGNNTAALFTAADGNNQTAQATVNAWVITNTEGYQGLDVSGDGSDEFYYSQWNLGVQSQNDLYEFGKDIQRRGTAETIHGMSGALFRGITHEWLYDGITGAEPATNEEYVWGTFLDVGAITGTYTVGEVVTGGTSGAVGRLLSVDATNTSLIISTESGTWQNGEVVTGTTSGATSTSSAAPVGQATGGGYATILAADTTTNDEVWVQLLKGTAPGDNAVCYEDTDHTREITVAGTVTQRTVSAPFIGVSTGSAINPGAFGLGIDPTDLTAASLVVDLNGDSVTPPNNVTFTVNGLVSGEDRVLVGPEDGAGGLDTDQFTLAATYTSATQTTIQVNTTIPSDTPSSGTIRVQRDSGIFDRITYSSYATDTFTITSTDFSIDNATSGNETFISYIDELASGTSASFTSVYSSDRDLFIRVRDGGVTPIKTFETTGTLGNAGGSATAIRTSDE